MEKQSIKINNIPAIIWGKQSQKAYIYVHGKSSYKEFAKDFAQIAVEKGYQTISFDLPEHGERKQETSYKCNIFNGITDLNLIAEYVFKNWNNVSLYACSVGAFFSINAYKDKPFEKCLFQSPIVDMEYLIKQMFMWFNVTEEELSIKKKIETPFEVLDYDYFQFVKNNPTNIWKKPTSILYAEKDNLQPISIISNFVKQNNCKLEISKDSEHPFLAETDKPIVTKWFKETI